MSDGPEPYRAARALRGILLALPVVPLGIALFLVLWQVGPLCSIVGVAVAWGAHLLYRVGSGIASSGAGAVVVSVVTTVTLVLSLIAAMAFDFATRNFDLPTAVTAQFWSTYWNYFPQFMPTYAITIAVVLAFGVLGCLSAVRHGAAHPPP